MAGGLILAVTAASVQTSDPRYPFCMTVIEWGGPRIECSFTPMPAVRRYRVGPRGPNPFCAYERKNGR
jgi:hypothetical protein